MTKRIPITNGNWEGNSLENIIEEFNEDAYAYRDAELIYASYDIDGYEGEAFVLFWMDNKLYEAHGSHCSCYGLEDQWDPEIAELDAILMRSDIDDSDKEKIKELVDELQEEGEKE